MSVVLESLETALAQAGEQAVAWRRHLHQHPELSFHEDETSQFIYDTLLTFPGLIVTRPTRTSVMARLVTDRPGKVLALRADMDALPIQEENEFTFRSTRDGVMHACGHDGHTAMLLAAAQVLAQERARLSGEIRFLFQHAEELFPGGAQEMVDAGVMEGVDLVLGTHLWASLPVGSIQVGAGPLMAAPDTFRIRIIGKGGHAAHPDQTIDSIAIGAQVVTNLQHIVARNNDPLEPLVVSVTRFTAGTADNVIPGTAELGGTVRTFDATLRDRVPELMERIVKGITEAHGASYELHYQRGYRPVINNAEAADLLRSVLVDTFGASSVLPAVPSMGGEDFSAFLQKAPGCFFFLGAGNREKGIDAPHHHPRFTVDETALPMGVRAFVAAALHILQ